jgi:hypothetical protein
MLIRSKGRMLRRLLNIASIVCLVVCVALMAMWVRSYYRYDELQGNYLGVCGFSVGSNQGRVVVEYAATPLSKDEDWNWKGLSFPADDLQQAEVALRLRHTSVLGFSSWRLRTNCQLTSIPIWFLVLATGWLAMAFRLRWPWRFTVRSMFIATTFLAVVLGIIAWLDRAWIGK